MCMVTVCMKRCRILRRAMNVVQDVYVMVYILFMNRIFSYQIDETRVIRSFAFILKVCK